MKKIFKNIIIITTSIIGGCILLISMSKILSIAVVKTINFVFGGLPTELQKDSNGNVIYQDGRKNIQSYGDRKQFTIFKGFRSETNEKTWSLFDRDKNKDIDTDITGYEFIPIYVYTKNKKGGYTKLYREKAELKPYVYAIGKKGYTKLNYETAEIQQSQDISEFSEEDQDIFKNLKRSKN